MPRSAEWIAAILGVLKSGAAFLPIDPEHPPALIDKMLRDCGADSLSDEKSRKLAFFPDANRCRPR